VAALKTLDLLHRWIGGVIGLVLALLGLSGALLVHRDAWIMLPHAEDAYVADPAAISVAVERIMADPATRPQSLVLAREGFGLHRLTYEHGAGAYADQSGVLVTRWASQWERPEIWLFDFHHHLFADDAGETVVGVAGLCGMVFVISGVILWWRTRKTFEFRLWPKRLSRPAIVRQHRDLGVVIAPLLLLLCYTGAAMVFRPVSALLLGPSAPAVIAKASKAPAPTGARLAAKPDWAGMIAAARARFPDAQLRTIGLPRKDGGFVTLRMKRPGEWTPNGRTTLYFAADTGRLVLARDALSLPGQAQGYSTFYPLHAAKVGGLAYRLVITFVGLALAVLGSLAVWSFWFRRPRSPARSR
jgi:uncharacterized iron-regulated membrane protein